MAVIDDGVFFPNLFSGSRIDGDQPAIVGSDKDFAFVERDTAVHDVAAALVTTLPRHFGIVGPNPLSSTHIDGMNHTPRRRYIHNSVDNERRRFNTTQRFEIVSPLKT